MAEYCLSCCSTVDLTKEQLEERKIRYINFHYSLDGEDLRDDMWQTMSPNEMYQRMLAGAEAKTSQVNVEEYVEHFESILREGKDVLHLTLSSGISGTLNSANIAREEVAERYPERKIYIVDSLAACSGGGLLINKLADLRDEGLGIEEVYQWAESHKLECNHWFFSSDLTFFVRGGRVSKSAGLIGSALKICPLMTVAEDGSLVPREKIRTKKKAMRRLVDVMTERAKAGIEYADECYISHSDAEEDCKTVIALLEDRFPNLKDRIRMYPIGATIGSHTGPGTIALFFWGKSREDLAGAQE